VGILNPHLDDRAVVVAACAEGYDGLGEAEQAFEALGAALANAGLVM
jgi:beta-lactamase class A